MKGEKIITLLLLAWRNVWRNKRRSLVVISSIAFGIFAMIISMGIMNGFNVQMVENTIGISLGHISIHRKGWQDEMKLGLHFIPTPALMARLKSHPEIEGFSPKIKTEGIIRSSATSRQVMVIGIEPDLERTSSAIFKYTLQEKGSRFLTNSDSDAILISKELAEKLELQIGDKAVLMLQDTNRQIHGAGLKVTGLYQTPVDAFDKFSVFVPLKKIQELSLLGQGISQIVVRLKNGRNAEKVKASLQSALDNPSLEILTWKEMDPSLVRAIKLFDQMMYIFFAIIFITVVFSVANTLIMAIMERFHEIGVMKSIGTRPSWIFSLIVMEAGFLGLAGLLTGTAGGIVLTLLLSHTGIDFSFYMESMRSWGTGSVIYPTIKMLDMIMAALIVLVTTFLAALYPAVKAARLKPLEALHYV